MTMDQKIDEVLKIVGEQGERSEFRDNQLLRLIQELDKKNDARFSRLEERDQELLELTREERNLNNSRFTQVSTALMDLRKNVDAGFTAVNAKIGQVHESLSSDINAFGEDLYETKRRVTRLEKKLPS